MSNTVIAFIHYINGRYTNLNEYVSTGDTVKEAVHKLHELALQSGEVFPFDDIKIYAILKDGTIQTIKQ